MTRRDGDDAETGGGTNYQRIADLLRGDILDQRFSIGERLKIVALAKRFRVSQMPVREALQQLQGEGLMRLIPNRGAVVRAVDEKFIMNVYDIREILEAFFTRRAVLVATPADIAELRMIQSTYDRYDSPDDVGMRIKLNLSFHACIYRLAGNEDARELIDRHNILVRVLTHCYNHSGDRVRQICKQHRDIIAAMADGDAERGGEIAAQHMRDARDELLRKFRDDPRRAMAKLG
jgi:DNA-binding GntR family transcriptional regulator